MNLPSICVHTVCGLDDLARHGANRVTHVLSVLDPDAPEPPAFAGYGPHRRAVLRFHDPVRFTEQSWMRVTLQGQPVDWLNELECTDDAIYANVWVSTPLMKNSTIVQINPETGEVEALIDASALVREVDVASKEPDAVLNGIAIEPGSQRIFLTGKYWPTLFEVVFEPAPTSSP